MRPSTLPILLLVLSGCAALGSAQDEALQITAPVDGAFVPEGDVRVQGRIDLAGVSEVTINGEVVPVHGGAFETRLALAEGPAMITASVDGHQDVVAVTVDTTDPVVVIESPEAGTFSNEQRLHVRGRVNDRNVASVTLNGAEIEVGDDGLFDHVWDVAPGAHRIRVEATDRAGRIGRGWSSVVWGDFQTEDAPHLDAMMLDLGADALEGLANGVEPFLASENLEPLMMGANPVVDGFWGHLDVEGESHGQAQLSFVPRDGYLQISLVLPDVRVPLRADLAVGGDITGNVTVERAFVTGRVNVGTARGLPDISVSDAEVVLEGLLIDIDGLASWIDRNVVTRAAQGRLEDQIQAMITEQIPVRMEGALTSLAELKEVEVADGAFVIESNLASLSTTREGLSASVDLGMNATRPVPELADKALGSLILGTEIPPRGTDGNVYAAVSTDLINDALHTAWLSGALTRQVDSFVYGDQALNVQLLSLLLPGVGADVPPETLVGFQIEAALPPVVGPTEDGLFAGDLADLHVTAFATVDGEQVTLFSASVGAHASLVVHLEGGAVSFEVPELSFMADVIEGPASLPDGEMLDDILTTIVSGQVETLLNPVSLEIPSLDGFSIDAPMASYQTGYLTFSADLSYTP